MVTLRPTDAVDQVRAALREWAALPDDHPLHAGPDLRERVEHAADSLGRRIAGISDVVPVDLEINDVYPANICARRSPDELSLRFFDFGNAVRGHPFVTFHGFLDSVEEWNRAPLSAADRDSLCEVYLAIWSERLHTEPELLRGDLEATQILVIPHRLLSWLRLVPHADPIELRARAEIPRKWMGLIAGLGN